MATVLVVANETLASRTLVDAIRRRHEQSEAHFVLVAPQNRAASGLVSYEDVLRDAAQTRIDMTVSLLAEDGIDAEGEVFDPDPFSAVLDAVAEFKPTEIIISTHPESRSGWLGRDLIERVQNATGLPVEHVVTDLEAERGGGSHTLVVANQTAGTPALIEHLRSRAAEGPRNFIVLIPQGGKQGHFLEEARERLHTVLDTLRDAGLDVVGSVGDPDPFTAIMNALSFYKVDDIVISTLPETRSGWLRADLVERVRRATSEPVEHIVAEQMPAEQEAEA